MERHEFETGIQGLVEQTRNQSAGIWDADENRMFSALYENVSVFNQDT